MFGISNEPPTRWLYLPVESRVREFDGRLLIACCAVERGYRVVFGKKNAITRSYPMMPRGIIFERSLAKSRTEEFAHLVEQGFRIGSSDEESIFFYQQPEGALKQRISAENLKIADWYFCWGKKQAEIIHQAHPEYADKVITTGSYRNDLYREEFHGIWQDQIDALRQRYGKFILFPSNFSRANSVKGGIKDMLNFFVKHGGITNKEEEAHYTALLNHTTEGFEAFKAVLPKVRAAFPDHTLILRRHPGEIASVWEDFAKDNPGMIAVHEGPILPWLVAADAVFHHGCSTGLEAFMLGKPSIPYHPVFDDRFDRHLSTRIGPIAHNVDELIGYLRMAINGEPLPRGDLSWLDDYSLLPDGLSSDLIMDALDKVEMEPDCEKSWSRVVSAMKFKYGQIRNRLKRRVKRAIGNPAKPTFSTQQWGYLSADDVQDMVHVLQKATGRFPGIKVKKLEGQVFVLSGNEVK